ncbi:MAG: leucine-rich repeat domain-containing protein [Bacteroides sp.]|nr:leucine-rich repeat domain-containing protein [Bacteroides sp.]
MRPDEANGGECELTLDVFPNKSGKERQATLKFMRNDESLVGSVLLMQVPAVQCQLIDSKATVGSLFFKFSVNERAKFVRYVLSNKYLSQNELDVIFLDNQRSSELALTEGQTTFDLTFDNLIPATTYYLYLRSLDKNWVNVGLDVSKEATTAMQESKHDLILEVSTNPANDFTVYLPFCCDNLQGTIDWGDGQTEQVKDWLQSGIKHVYNVTTATTYEVRFSGILTELQLLVDNSPAVRQNTLLAVKQWGYTGLTRIDLEHYTSLKSVAPDTEGAFRGVKHFDVEPYGGSFTDTGLEAIPEGFFDYAVNATSFDCTFGDCKKLASIPAGLFKNCVKANSFQRTFSECELLEAIPENLFTNCTKVTAFWATFYGCKKLLSIPENLFATNVDVESFEATFKRCESLKVISAKLFANSPKALYFGRGTMRAGTYSVGSGVFEECISLQSIPEDLFAGNPLAKDMSYIFANCKLLTSIPEDLFKKNTQIEQLEAAFLNCLALKSIPVTMFDTNRKLANVTYLFSGCSGVKGESPYTFIDGKKVHLYERDNYITEFVSMQYSARCFTSCTELTDYPDMPALWKAR